MAAARGLPIPKPDEIPPELEYKYPCRESVGEKTSVVDSKDIQHLTVPITSRSQSYNSERSFGSGPASSLPSPTSPVAPGTSSSPLFRSRAKTLAGLTSSSKHSSQVDLTPREVQLSKDPFVNGQPIEAYLYKDATECPICFLYYPPYLNRTRCCDQPICSECFVQIKRPDPHPPEHGEHAEHEETTDAAATGVGTGAPEEAAAAAASSSSSDCQLVSESSACPFCVQPDFGVTYSPPPFRRGLVYATDQSARPAWNVTSALSSSSSLASGTSSPTTGRRRATSLSATDPSVVTTDRIRPDWAQKLANARAHAARRSAAATALHTAAYLMNANPSASETRNFGLSRRSMMRRAAGIDSPGSSGRSGSPALNALAFLTERRLANDSADEGPGAGGSLAPPRDSSRRSRMDDLEDMMVMEAIRLSLASEEERRKREEKEAKKEAKRREKEAKKADKAARKSGLYSNNASSLMLDSGASDQRLGKTTTTTTTTTIAPTATTTATTATAASSSVSSGAGDETCSSSVNKGKGIERVPPVAAATANESSESNSSGGVGGGGGGSAAAPIAANPSPPETTRRSHLRHVSSVSSSFSSTRSSTTEEPAGPSGENAAGLVGPPGSAGAAEPGPPSEGEDGKLSTEPMFNFRSLTAMIGDEDKDEGSTEHVEDAKRRGLGD